MNADEFLNRNIPSKRQSKLLPFRDDLFKLREANLTLDRLVEFLALNGVSVSKAAVSNFLKAQTTSAASSRSDAINSQRPEEKSDHSLKPSGRQSPAPSTENSKRLSAKELQASIEQQAAKYFPNRFAKASDA